MKRVIDKPYFTYSAYTVKTSGINVKCPKCKGLGFVTAGDGSICVRCTACKFSKTEEQKSYQYKVENLCKECGRYYRVEITDKNSQHFKCLNVACPHCGYVMQGEVRKSSTHCSYASDIQNGCEPYFGLELWFLTSFDNKPVWAINREHLAYLIDYLSADLREKPTADYVVMKTQADHLPTFMKTAKNRDGIVKVLKRMQENHFGTV